MVRSSVARLTRARADTAGSGPVPPGSSARLRVLLAGRGAPDVGGIPRFLSQLLESERLADSIDLDFVNFGASLPPARRLSLANVGETLRHARQIHHGSRDADVVHLHSATAPLSTLVRVGLLAGVARRRGAAVVVHAHGGLFADWVGGGRLRQAVARAAFNRATLVVAASHDVHRSLEALCLRTPCRHQVNGVDTDRFVPVVGRRPGPPVVLFAGHLVDRKGVFDLISASIRLAGSGVDHRVVLAGRADNGPTELARAVGLTVLPDHIDVRGLVGPDDMVELYQEADIFCLPSWWEATPFAVLEAMSCGLPVVATDVGDVDRMVGDAGHVVAPRDIDGLASALEALVIDPMARRRLGAMARARVLESYSLRATVEAMDTIYRDTIYRDTMNRDTMNRDTMKRGAMNRETGSR